MRSVSTRTAGLAILVLGLWGGIIPFVGPYFHYTLGPDRSWAWTMGRLWLDILPAVAAVLGGFMLIGAGPRPHARLGALLALAGGIWFAIGPEISQLWTAGGAQGAGHGSAHRQMLEMLGYHTGLGVLIAGLAGYALPRFPLMAETTAAAAAGAATGAHRGARAGVAGDPYVEDPHATGGYGTRAGRDVALAEGAGAGAAGATMAHEPAAARGTGAYAGEPATTAAPAATTAADGTATPADGTTTAADGTATPAATTTAGGAAEPVAGTAADGTAEPVAAERPLTDRGAMYAGYSGGVRRRRRGGLLSVFTRH